MPKKHMTTKEFVAVLRAQAAELNKIRKPLQQLGSPKNRPPKDLPKRIEALARELEKYENDDA